MDKPNDASNDPIECWLQALPTEAAAEVLQALLHPDCVFRDWCDGAGANEFVRPDDCRGQLPDFLGRLAWWRQPRVERCTRQGGDAALLLSYQPADRTERTVAAWFLQVAHARIVRIEALGPDPHSRQSLELAYGLQRACIVKGGRRAVELARRALRRHWPEPPQHSFDRCLVSPDLVLLPIQYIGCRGILYDRAADSVHIIGSGLPFAEIAVWAWYKGQREVGFDRDLRLYDIEILALSDRARPLASSLARRFDPEAALDVLPAWIRGVWLLPCLTELWQAELQGAMKLEFVAAGPFPTTDAD